MRLIEYPSGRMRVFSFESSCPPGFVSAARVTCYLTVRLSGELWLKPFAVLAVTMSA